MVCGGGAGAEQWHRCGRAVDVQFGAVDNAAGGGQAEGEQVAAVAADPSGAHSRSGVVSAGLVAEEQVRRLEWGVGVVGGQFLVLLGGPDSARNVAAVWTRGARLWRWSTHLAIILLRQSHWAIRLSASASASALNTPMGTAPSLMAAVRRRSVTS